MEKDVSRQLKKIAAHTERIALQKGPEFFDGVGESPIELEKKPEKEPDFFHYYFMLDRSLRDSLTSLNADYILLDQLGDVINPFPEDYFHTSEDLINIVTTQISSSNLVEEMYYSFTLNHIQYVAVIKPVSEKNSFGLGWIIIYSSLEKMNQLRWGINIILLGILLFSAILVALISSKAARKISEPFSSLNQHIKMIAERNFGRKISIPVDDELQEFVSTINLMSDKLQTYDQAQKTFLQNASHEFRTPLMSIQSYAEGIIYDIVDSKVGATIILEETRRMTSLVEDLLYLSRLESIEEHNDFEMMPYDNFMLDCLERIQGIAQKASISIANNNMVEDQTIYIDVEKLPRAIVNVLTNCIRYAKSEIEIHSRIIQMKQANTVVTSRDNLDYNKDATEKEQTKAIQIEISDDGEGIDEIEIDHIFERFYKGKAGQFGLGLAISKSIISKHGGSIYVVNGDVGTKFIIVLPI